MDRKIKIVHVAQGFGGLFTYIKQIVNNIDRNLFDLEIVAPKNEECKLFCEEHSIKYYCIDLKRGFNPLKDILGLIKLCKYLNKSKPTLIHVHSAKGGFLGRIAGRLVGVKSIYTPHAMSYLSFTGYKRIVFLLLEVIAKRFTDEVLACSESEKIRCVYEVGIPEQKIKVITNSIKINQQYPSLLNELHLKLNIGVIARLTYQKNPILFVEIANKVIQKFPYATFSILGAGLHDHLKHEVLKKIKEYNLENSFVIYEWGHFNTAEDYLKSLDIFLMPSVFEGLPFSLLEAMNENVLCITSKGDGCTDVINNNQNGFSCLELEDYVNAVEKIVDNPSLNFEMKYQAKHDLIKKYNLDFFILELQDYYTKSIKG